VPRYKGPDDPVTAELVEEWVVGILEEWLDGHYTERLADDRQRQVKLWSDGTYVVKDRTGDNPDRKFKVSVVVQEVK